MYTIDTNIQTKIDRKAVPVRMVQVHSSIEQDPPAARMDAFVSLAVILVVVAATGLGLLIH